MVVLIAAVWAYRRHLQQQQGGESADPLLDYAFQRAESLGKSSSELLQSLNCTSRDVTRTSAETRSNDSSVSLGRRPACAKTPRKMSSPEEEPIPEESSVFPDHIRQEWINAVFGPSFFPPHFADGYTPPKSGSGLSGIRDYVCYSVDVPAQRETDEKLGITISKIALGVFVQKVVEGSQAHAAGVREGSILVSINGMGMLAEPSKQALERLWQYEGHFAKVEKSQFVCLTLIKDGILHKATLLASPPYGISWAPCGNFALVQRSYSVAQEAGVRRGSLVAAISQKSLRVLDHEGAATELKQMYGKDIHLSLAYTPAPSRTGYYENKSQNQKTSPRKNPTISQMGVEVRVHPLEYGISSMFFRETSVQKRCGVSDLAHKVVCGQVEAPTGLPIRKKGNNADAITNSRIYGSCPHLENVMDHWGLMDALVYCCRFLHAEYSSEEFITQPRILETLDETTRLPRVLQHNTECAKAFVVQFVSCLCSQECNPKSIAAYLVDLCANNADFRQRMYFLLHSFSASFAASEQQSPETVSLLQWAQSQLIEQLERECKKALKTEELKQSYSSPPKKVEETAPVIVTEEKRVGKKKKSMLRALKKKAGSKKMESPVQEPVLRTSSNSVRSPPPASPISTPAQQQPPSGLVLLKNMKSFLGELDGICSAIERSLLKSFSQKVADWALQPWSPTKATALARLTEVMRDGLCRESMPVANPIDSSELLVGVDTSESYILPSAHFPLLLSFDVQGGTNVVREKIYRTRVEVISLRGKTTPSAKVKDKDSLSYCVQGAISGTVKDSGRSVCKGPSETHVWNRNNVMTFDTRSSWGSPQTLALRLLSEDVKGNEQISPTKAEGSGRLDKSSVVGSCWIDLRPMWNRLEQQPVNGFSTVTCHAQLMSFDEMKSFDQHGQLSNTPVQLSESFELELRLTTEMLEFGEAASGFQSLKRMLLYKHDDDVRQDLFAIDFIRICDDLLKSSGLDMKLLTFGCIPVGAKSGFVEWVPGSVPLSDIVSLPTDKDSAGDEVKNANDSGKASLLEVSKAGLTKYQYFRRLKSEGSAPSNRVQEFLRSVAYDADAPYLIQQGVMDTYVKSCAGYCVITYLLGVGDRHLDNLLLHQRGYFFHCDYSFMLGNDPKKKHLPMRISEDMVNGMGGRGSDNFAMFLSLAGAAFVTFRRHENVRVLLSLLRLMAPAILPDVSLNNDPNTVLVDMRDRLCLDLDDGDAIAHMESLIESSISSKMWVALDAIHSLGKRF